MVCLIGKKVREQKNMTYKVFFFLFDWKKIKENLNFKKIKIFLLFNSNFNSFFLFYFHPTKWTINDQVRSIMLSWVIY